jgi:hypothetical protein
MTFRDLQKLVSAQQKENTRKELFQRLQNKSFWIWNKEEHKQQDIKTNGDCCFNHIIGLPQKDGNDKPLYDYQQIIFDSLVAQTGSKHLWIKKATGLGISEFMLRFMAWLCLKDNSLSGSQMCIVTGPRIDLAIALIDRMKKLFTSSKGLAVFDTKETVIELNGVKIEAFPSHHLDAMRGSPNVSFILYALVRIYTAEEIEKATASPSFEREYNLKYLGRIGNVFHTKDIEAAIEKGRKYNPDDFSPYYSFTSRSMGIDPAYGSSAFGIVLTEWADGIVQIMHAEEYHRPDYNEMLSLVYELMSKYQVDKVYIDGANPSFIKSLKLQIGEDADYDKVIARYRSEGFGDEAALKDMKVVPVNFNKEHKAMLGHCKMMVDVLLSILIDLIN